MSVKMFSFCWLSSVSCWPYIDTQIIHWNPISRCNKRKVWLAGWWFYQRVWLPQSFIPMLLVRSNNTRLSAVNVEKWSAKMLDVIRYLRYFKSSHSVNSLSNTYKKYFLFNTYMHYWLSWVSLLFWIFSYLAHIQCHVCHVWVSYI